MITPRSRVLRSLLREAAGMAVTGSVAAVCASLVPALRAARVNPVSALRRL